MTRVDFYILPDMDIDARDRFACRLANRAVDNGHHVHVHVDDADAQQRFDKLMWSYPAHRFLAHGLAGDPSGERAGVISSAEVEITPASSPEKSLRSISRRSSGR